MIFLNLWETRLEAFSFKYSANIAPPMLPKSICKPDKNENKPDKIHWENNGCGGLG